MLWSLLEQPPLLRENLQDGPFSDKSKRFLVTTEWSSVTKIPMLGARISQEWDRWLVGTSIAQVCPYRVRGLWGIRINPDCIISESEHLFSGRWECPRSSHRRSGARAGLGRKDEQISASPGVGPRSTRLGALSWGKRGSSLGGEGVVPAVDKLCIVRSSPEADRYAGLSTRRKEMPRWRRNWKEIPWATKLYCPEQGPEIY